MARFATPGAEQISSQFTALPIESMQDALAAAETGLQKIDTDISAFDKLKGPDAYNYVEDSKGNKRYIGNKDAVDKSLLQIKGSVKALNDDWYSGKLSTTEAARRMGEINRTYSSLTNPGGLFDVAARNAASIDKLYAEMAAAGDVKGTKMWRANELDNQIKRFAQDSSGGISLFQPTVAIEADKNLIEQMTNDIGKDLQGAKEWVQLYAGVSGDYLESRKLATVPEEVIIKAVDSYLNSDTSDMKRILDKKFKTYIDNGLSPEEATARIEREKADLKNLAIQLYKRDFEGDADIKGDPNYAARRAAKKEEEENRFVFDDQEVVGQTGTIEGSPLGEGNLPLGSDENKWLNSTSINKYKGKAVTATVDSPSVFNKETGEWLDFDGAIDVEYVETGDIGKDGNAKVIMRVKKPKDGKVSVTRYKFDELGEKIGSGTKVDVSGDDAYTVIDDWDNQRTNYANATSTERVIELERQKQEYINSKKTPGTTGEKQKIPGFGG